MGFKENLKQYREGLGITAKDFARQIGVRYTTYVNYENVGTEPKYETLIKIATALHVSIDDLLGFKAGETNKNITICKRMGLSLKVHEVNGEVDCITFLDENKQPIAKLSSSMFNQFVQYIFFASALSASSYFSLLVSVLAPKIEEGEAVFNRLGMSLAEVNMFDLFEKKNAEKPSTTLSPMAKAVSLVPLIKESDSLTNEEIRDWIRQYYPDYKKNKA